MSEIHGFVWWSNEFKVTRECQRRIRNRKPYKVLSWNVMLIRSSVTWWDLFNRFDWWLVVQYQCRFVEWTDVDFEKELFLFSFAGWTSWEVSSVMDSREACSKATQMKMGTWITELVSLFLKQDGRGASRGTSIKLFNNMTTRAIQIFSLGLRRLDELLCMRVVPSVVRFIQRILSDASYRCWIQPPLRFSETKPQMYIVPLCADFMFVMVHWHFSGHLGRQIRLHYLKMTGRPTNWWPFVEDHNVSYAMEYFYLANLFPYCTTF